jgi:4-carboxymuconolactone decarboxylase
MSKVSVKKNAVLGDEDLKKGLMSINKEFGEFCIRVSGETWGKPLIDQKTKILIVLAVDIVNQHMGKQFANHLAMAKKQGITHEEINELVLFMTVYAGFNKTGGYYSEVDNFFKKTK